MSSPAPDQPRSQPWKEKNPLVATLLALLVPGLGHFYQGRHFKGLIYLVCILSAFFWGMSLGEGSVVYVPAQPNGASRISTLGLSYSVQLCVGIVSWPALVQHFRTADPQNLDQRLLELPLDSTFEGTIRSEGPGQDDGHVPVLVGQIFVESVADRFGPVMKGRITGTLDGKAVELKLSGGFELERGVSGSPRRLVVCNIQRDPNQHPDLSQRIVGTVPRKWLDSFEVAPERDRLNSLHARLGKIYDIALVFTWIAGLLNILVVFDCVQGPAYGFGDEDIRAAVSGTAVAPAVAGPPAGDSAAAASTSPGAASPSEPSPA